MVIVNFVFFRDAKDIYGDELKPSTNASIAIDLRACFPEMGDSYTLKPGDRVKVPLGIAIDTSKSSPSPNFNMAGYLYSRSGLGATQGIVLAQGVGLIDPDYRGELTAWMLNTSNEKHDINRGDRIVQLAFQPFATPAMVLVEQLIKTERGSGGFGHTGIK